MNFITSPKKDEKKEVWENVKLGVTYGLTGLVVILLFRSMFHRDHGIFDRLNLNKRNLPSSGKLSNC